MKKILLFSILFYAVALPVISELSDADLNKIRLIVNEEVKKEVAISEKRLKEYVSLKIETVNANIESNEKQINSAKAWSMGLIIALIGLIAAAIVVPHWWNRKDHSLQNQIEVLTQEIETLKQQGIVNP